MTCWKMNRAVNILFIFLFLVIPNLALADISTGLIANWNLEEGTGTDVADSSGNLHSGTLNGGASWVDGRIGDYAVEFDGTDDYMSMLDPAGMDANTYTISFWLNGTSSFSGTVFRLHDSSSVTSYNSKYEVSVTPSGVLFRTGNGDTTADDDNFSTDLTAGNWWHIVCTLDGDDSKACYKNGSLITTATNDVDVSNNVPVGSLVGTNRSSSSTYNWYEGQLDDIRLYNRALSSSDVLQLYALGDDTESPTIPTNLSVATSSLLSISLTWDASTDDLGLAGYKIFRNGSLLATTSDTYYSDSSVSPNTTYQYSILAYDNYDNESAQTSAVSATSSARTFEVNSLGGGDYTTISACVADTLPGDVCEVSAGTYEETVTPTISGTYSNPIFIRAQTGEVVNLDAVNFDSVNHVFIEDIKVKAISQWSVTWTFDDYYEIGLFAAEDYWVLGPVTISSITPAYDGSENGWEVNPQVASTHGFGSVCRHSGNFDSDLVPSLPYTSTESVESIVKVISSEIDQSCVETAVVLTVVSSAPANNGRTVFRPPYAGTGKPFYNVSDLQTDLLPTYESVGTPPSLDTVVENFTYLRMEHLTAAARRDLRPQNAYGGGNSDGYSPTNTKGNHEALLRLMLDDDLIDKMPALIYVTQHGIDQAQMVIDGFDDYNDDGHDPGHRIIMAFAATILDITSAKTALLNASDMHEEHYLQEGENTYLWGETASEAAYWNYIVNGDGGRSHADPYGFIDGGSLGSGLASYQNITSQSWKGTALVGSLLSEIQNSWPESYWTGLKQYAERFVETGAWTQPDPCAPYTEAGVSGVDYGPDPANPGMCILDTDLSYYNSASDFACEEGEDCGRFPSTHGVDADGGQNRSAFVASMWDAYYELSNDTTPPSRSNASPTTEQEAGTTQVTLSLTTNENATCKYSTNSGTAYLSMSNEFTTTGETSHSVTISSLADGESYTYYVRCQDGSSNYNTNDYTISFSIGQVSVSSGGGGGGGSSRNDDDEIVLNIENNNTPSTCSLKTAPDMTLGSEGSNVVALQDMLIASGDLVIPVGLSKGYFGTLTQRALASWQANRGISPASGYFGPITRSNINCGTENTSTITTPTIPSTPVAPTTTSSIVPIILLIVQTKELVPDTFLAIADILRAGRPDILIPYQQLQDIKLLETLAGLVGLRVND